MYNSKWTGVPSYLLANVVLNYDHGCCPLLTLNVYRLVPVFNTKEMQI